MKKIIIKIFVIYVIFYICLGNMSICFGRSFDSACGEYVAQYAVDFIHKYCDGGNTYYDASGQNPMDDSQFWTGGSMGSGQFHTCCSVGIAYMYAKALGINIQDLGQASLCSDYPSMESNSNWETITNESDLQPGDIVYNSGHAEMIIENGAHVNFGNSPHSGVVQLNEYGFCNGTFNVGFRLASSVDVTPSGKVPESSSASSSTEKVEFSDFYFNGIPDGKYSLASKNLFSLIIETLAQIVDYVIGILTYIVRIVFVGITALTDNLFQWTIKSITNTSGEDVPFEMSSVDSDSPDNSQRITIEALIYNRLDLTNINIFDTNN